MGKMTLQNQFWLLLILLQWCFQIAYTCPSTCVCKWKGGKQTVECINNGLITIPDGMDQGTQVLDFSGNNLQILPRERFQRMGLINLQRIYLSRCKLSQIDDRSFRGLTNLVELDLSDNLLSSLPSETFNDFPNLMRLTVSNNPIRKISSLAFRPLSSLTTLEISNCELENIEDDAFLGLERLEWLKLDGNKLTAIRGSYLMPASLHGIDLHHNPWQCDCKLTELHEWLLNYNIPHSIEPRCSTPPRLHEVTIKTLNVDDFACLPDVSPTTMYLEISEGKNVSLLCQVSAIPEARISWWFQGRVLQNDSMVAPGFHLYYFVEEGTVEKKSELFIVNTNTEDNGTYVCVAENPAGKSQSNYTIRIIVREEVAVAVVMPFEYVIAIISAIVFLATLIIVVLILLFVRCRRQRNRRRLKERSKSVALNSPEQSDKDNEVDANAAITRIHKLMVANPGPVKVNGSVIQPPIMHHEVVVRGPLSEICPVSCVEAYQLSPGRGGQENPDLINDTESVGKERRSHREEGDGEEVVRDIAGINMYQETLENTIDEFLTSDPNRLAARCGAMWVDDGAFPMQMIASAREIPTSNFSTLPRRIPMIKGDGQFQHHHLADVHLSPGRFLDTDGYPIDFGLPKITPTNTIMLPLVPATSPQPSMINSMNYRTLPHSRGQNKLCNFSRETKYISSPQYDAPSYVTESLDIRYSLDGYPTSAAPAFPANEAYLETTSTFIPSPPAAYKTDVPGDISIAAETLKLENNPPIPDATTWTYSKEPCSENSKTKASANQNQIESAINGMLCAQPHDTRQQQESPDEGYEDGTEI